MKQCPCGSNHLFDQCCGDILCGNRNASTAETLMRSRYSAFVTLNIDYIVNTYAPEVRPEDERQEIEDWARSVVWDGLEIVDTQDGGVNDDTGYVEFKAHYHQDDHKMVLHEKSFFRKQEGEWFYVSGEEPVKSPVISKPKVERNAPCPCGSGKKYKKCCGR